MRVPAILTVVLVVFGGCAAEETPEAAPTPTAAEQAEQGPVSLPGTVNDEGDADLSAEGSQISMELEMDDFYFEPTFTKTAEGAQVSIELFNEGSADHTFTIDDLEIDTVLSSDDRQTVELTLPSDGPVRYYCRFHVGQGMQGAFYYVEGGSVAESSGDGAGGY